MARRMVTGATAIGMLALMAGTAAAVAAAGEKAPADGCTAVAGKPIRTIPARSSRSGSRRIPRSGRSMWARNPRQ